MFFFTFILFVVSLHKYFVEFSANDKVIKTDHDNLEKLGYLPRF